MDRFWVKDRNVSSQFFVMLLSTSSTEPSGTKWTFLDHYEHSLECLRLPSLHVSAAGSAATAINIYLALTLPLVLVIFLSKSSRVPSFLVSSCPCSPRGIKAAADFLLCSYPHFTAGETETLWIVSLPVELHRNVNALSKTRERVSISARIKKLLVLYFRAEFPSECAVMRDPNTRSGVFGF